MKLVGKPDAGNRPVRFDERGGETGRCRMAQATAPLLDSTRGTRTTRRGSRRHARLLEKRGIGARIEGTAALNMSNVVPTDGIAMVCLSYLDTTSAAHMRYMIRRARRKWPDARILLGCWLAGGNAASLAATLKPDDMALTLRDAVKSCIAAAQGQNATSAFGEHRSFLSRRFNRGWRQAACLALSRSRCQFHGMSSSSL